MLVAVVAASSMLLIEQYVVDFVDVGNCAFAVVVVSHVEVIEIEQM